MTYCNNCVMEHCWSPRLCRKGQMISKLAHLPPCLPLEKVLERLLGVQQVSRGV